jgi:hypothetical protein
MVRKRERKSRDEAQGTEGHCGGSARGEDRKYINIV